MRGPLARKRWWPVGWGITPANAGTTARPRSSRYGSPDHPRECGDHGWASRVWDFDKGSPPRMRGPPHDSATSSTAPRITPANAGTTKARHRPAEWPPDHPRECGDHGPGRGIRQREQGSPPRMRGPPTQLQESQPTNQDHPRECGDHNPPWVTTILTEGSPPRMRGPHARMVAAFAASGITPANAGTTGSIVTAVLGDRDHPRECGDHCRSVGRPKGRVDHPRECGDHRSRSTRDYHQNGSPPRMRGPQRQEGPR